MIRLKISLRTSRLSSGTFKLRVNNLEDENFATNGILIQFLVLQSSLQLNSETNFFRARNDDSFQIWRLPRSIPNYTPLAVPKYTPVHSKIYLDDSLLKHDETIVCPARRQEEQGLGSGAPELEWYICATLGVLQRQRKKTWSVKGGCKKKFPYYD